jgi:uncharacterized protein (DUF849 family)
MAHFAEKGILKPPFLAQIVLGVRYGAPASARSMAYLAALFPPGTVWAGFGIGRAAFPMLAQAFILGGHVRIGMEDTVEIAPGEPCTGNRQLVEKAARIVDDLGGRLATPSEARAIIGIGTP